MQAADDGDWPDWGDAQRKVWIKVDGTLLHGTLQAFDVGFDGEGEFPIWSIETDGAEFPLADVTEWGYDDPA